MCEYFSGDSDKAPGNLNKSPKIFPIPTSAAPQALQAEASTFGDNPVRGEWKGASFGPKCIFSKHRPSWPMLSISRKVRLSVRLSVCLFTFEVLFKRLFFPFPEVGCPIFLKIWNPWGKVMERSGLRFEHFLFGRSLKLQN